MPFAEINGLRLFFHEQGDASLPTVLFVHGTQGNASLWADVIDGLSDRFHCLALNHRGRAPSDAPDDPSAYGIEIFADDLAAFAAQRGLERCGLVGWSLGGADGAELLTAAWGTTRAGAGALVDHGGRAAIAALRWAAATAARSRTDAGAAPLGSDIRADHGGVLGGFAGVAGIVRSGVVSAADSDTDGDFPRAE